MCGLELGDLADRTSIPVVGGSSPVPTGVGLGIEVDEAELRKMAERTPQPLPAHIPVLRAPSHGVEVYGDIPRDVLGLDEGMLRGQSMMFWHEDGTPEWTEMQERVKALGYYMTGISKL